MQFPSTNIMFAQLIFQAAVLLFFVFGVFGFAVGVGLILNSEGMRRFFGVMNQWSSVRQPTKWLAVPRSIEGAVHRHRVWVGVVFVIGAVFGLLKGLDLAQVTWGLLPASRNTVAWMAESLAWFLIVGNAFALVVGLMLVFFPHALGGIEARFNRWYSTRQMGEGGDAMHLTVDKWAETYPRTAGCIIAAASLVLVVSYGMVLLGRA